MTRVRAVLAAMLCLAACGGGSEGGGSATMTLSSAFTGARYPIWVTLPEGYESGDLSYPVIYVTDAEFLNDPVTAEVRAQGYPAIVVAIGNNARRNIDYAPTVSDTDQRPGGAPAFYRFVSEELVPAIDAAYRVDPAFGRTLGGYSLGGLFTLYALFQERPEHRVFSHFIAGSPSIWYSAAALAEGEAQWAGAFDALDGSLFMAVGGQEGGMVQDMLTMAGTLRAEGLTGFAVATEVNPALDHFSNTTPAMREGLASVFR